MAKLVIQNQGMTGRAHELNVDRTTIGRIEDNTFQIPDPSVSSHHCEVLLQGSDILVRDLNSTNGSFIGDKRFTEQVLKPGQVFRIGQVELRLETEGMAPTPPPAPVTASVMPPAPVKKAVDSTMIMPRGVSLDQLEKGGRPPGFDTNTAFTKKTNKVHKYFIIGGVVFAVIIIVLIVIAFKAVNSGH